MNSRKFPRTMDEAFPHGPQYGCAIEKPVTTGERITDAAFAAFIGICLAAALVSWWSS